MLKQGWKLSGGEDTIWISKGKLEVRFDIKIATKKGAIYCGMLKRSDAQATETESVHYGVGTKISPQMAHALLGHACMRTTTEAAKHMGWILSEGNGKPCQDCAEAKAKQKNIPKITEGKKADVPNGGLFMDLATIKVPQSVNA